MKPSYFTINFGLSGCYMPDSHFGDFSVTRRGDLRDILADAIEFYEFPKSAISQVRLTRLWAHAKRHGLSVVSFSIDHKGHSIAFHGMTRAEYLASEAAAEL